MRHRIGVLIFLTFLALIAGCAVVVSSTLLKATKPGPQAKFTARVFSINPESATHVIVAIAITNTSNIKGTASCWDLVNDPAADLSDSPNLTPAIKPHETTRYDDDVTIADGNAYTLTQGQFWVTCSTDEFATPTPPWG